MKMDGDSSVRTRNHSIVFMVSIKAVNDCRWVTHSDNWLRQADQRAALLARHTSATLRSDPDTLLAALGRLHILAAQQAGTAHSCIYKERKT